MTSCNLNNDQFVAEVLKTGMVIVDAAQGKVYVRRGPGGLILKSPREVRGTNIHGYLHVKLSINGEKRSVRLHRVIWVSVHGVIPDGMVIHHKNNIKSDNRIENLAVVTPAENSRLAALDGLYLTGDRNKRTKLTSDCVAKIRSDYVMGKGTLRQLAKAYGISKSRVSQLVNKTAKDAQC